MNHTFEQFRNELRESSLVEAIRRRLTAIHDTAKADPAIWINRFSDEAILETAAHLETDPAAHSLPLYGLPFAVKDNIDVAGLPTTAACPAYRYTPARDAHVVALLKAAGAICIGKTNLDQFATGLVGVRSPYGIPKNTIDPQWIPGGSSSGSAVAVARGVVAFSLGTDTAGSGRIPAAMNGILGWKPTRGLLSNSGVVPACRSLDCVCVFANAPEDLQTIAQVLAHFDPEDPWSRRLVLEPATFPPNPTLAVPPAAEMEFFGDTLQQNAWEQACRQLTDQGCHLVTASCRDFFAAARLLYEGPWLAERYLVVKELLTIHPDALHPVTRTIISGGSGGTAADVFAAIYQLAELRRRTEALWEKADALLLPTLGRPYTVEEVLHDPLTLNSNLGFYTNFFNLLDLCGTAFPFGHRKDGLPFGTTIAAPASHDLALLAWVRQLRPPPHTP